MLTTEQIALIEKHFNRCEFDDECDFCKSPEFGTYCRENFGETEFYICGKCAMAKAQREEAENVALDKHVDFLNAQAEIKTLYLSAILIAAHIPARKATPTGLENFEQFLKSLNHRELLATDRTLEAMRQSFSFVIDERAVEIVTELGRMIEIVREILYEYISHAQLIDEPR